MWSQSRKARWSLLTLWAGLAVVLAVAAGISNTAANGLDLIEARDQQSPCSVAAADLVQVASLETDGTGANANTNAIEIAD
jgi:hypothetical protein